MKGIIVFRGKLQGFKTKLLGLIRYFRNTNKIWNTREGQ